VNVPTVMLPPDLGCGAAVVAGPAAVVEV